MLYERTDKYRIHSYDTDVNGNLFLPVLTRFLQETAWLNSEDMGLGYSKMLSNRRAWVLYKQYIELNEVPVWGDDIEIRTWPSQYNKLFCFREFEVIRKQAVLGKVSTSWLVIDLEKRTPLRTAAYYDYNLDNPLIFPDIITDKMKIDTKDAVRTELQVQTTDIDVNNHVNNSCYLQWCLNSYRLDFYREHKLRTIEQQFAAEAKYRDELSIYTVKKDKLHYEHCLKRGKQDVYLLKLEWERLKTD